jgi:hypothetical protein
MYGALHSVYVNVAMWKRQGKVAEGRKEVRGVSLAEVRDAPSN